MVDLQSKSFECIVCVFLCLRIQSWFLYDCEGIYLEASVNIGSQPVNTIVCLDICFNRNLALIVSIMWLQS